jgi:hypothetical protein
MYVVASRNRPLPYIIRFVRGALSYGRANKLVGQLVELGVLSVVDSQGPQQRR